MGNETKQKLIEKLLNRKRKNDNDSTFTIKVDDMELDAVKLPIPQLLSIVDKYGDTISDQFNLAQEVIYMSVPLLRENELVSECDVVNPHDVVSKIFGDDVSIVDSLSAQIQSKYNIKSEIKN